MGELKVLFMKCAEFSKYGRFQIEVRQKKKATKFCSGWSSCQKLASQFVRSYVFLGFCCCCHRDSILHSPFSLSVTQMLQHKTDCNLWKSVSRKLAFAHVMSLKRGQDEREYALL